MTIHPVLAEGMSECHRCPKVLNKKHLTYLTRLVLLIAGSALYVSATVAPEGSLSMRLTGYRIQFAQKNAVVATVSSQPSQPNDADVDAYAIVRGDSMSVAFGSDDKWRVTQLRSKLGDNFAWFRHEGNEYVVTDAASLEELHKFMEPLEKIDQLRAQVDEERAKLDGRRTSVRVGVRASDLKRELESIETEIRSNAPSADVIAKLQALIAALQPKTGEPSEADMAPQEVRRNLEHQREMLNEERDQAARGVQQKVRQFLVDQVKNGNAQPVASDKAQ